MLRIGICTLDQTKAFQDCLDVMVKGKAAADHGAILGRRHLQQAQISKDLTGSQIVGDPAHLRERLAGGGGVVKQLAGHHLANQRIIGQRLHQLAAIVQFGDLAAGVHHDHLLIFLIGLRFAQQAGKGRKAGAGGQKVNPLAGQKRVMHQSANGFGAQDDLVADLDVLQARGQRAVGNLDRIELQLVIPGRRGDGIGAQQGFAGLAQKANHHKFTRAKPQAARARDAKREQTVGPMCHRSDDLGIGQMGFGGAWGGCFGHLDRFGHVIHLLE